MIKPDIELKVRLTQDIWKQVEDTAKEYDVSTGVIIREALKQFLAQNNPPAFSDQRQVDDEIRQKFQSAVETAKSWDALNDALRGLNLELTPKGGGLSLRAHDTKAEICKASEAGYAYSKLIKRFAAPFPGHPAEWLADRVLGGDY